MRKGMTFKTGPNEETDLTDGQILEQCKMYIAALRIADEFGCDGIGIQYQQGSRIWRRLPTWRKDCSTMSTGRQSLRQTAASSIAGEPLPHFNEVDECAGLDALVTNRVWTAAARSGDDAARCALGRALQRTTASTNSSGCSRSPAPCPPSTLSAGMPAR